MVARVRCRILSLVVACALALGCGDAQDAIALPEPPPPNAPADNPTTLAKVELGRHLFYDARLSQRENLSCASCHLQERAFSDGRALSTGTTGQHTARNAQSLVNAAYASTFTWANFVLTSLEQQALVPLFGEDPVELGLSGRDREVIARLRAEPRYEALFAAAFPDDADPIRLDRIVKALAAFERALVSLRAPYDHYLAGDTEALSPEAVRGLALFESARLGCTHCHGGALFSAAMALPDDGPPALRFENNGLAPTFTHGSGGLYELTGKEEDRGRFRPPSLRNVAVTAPYMHDGSLATLDDVIAHYEAGGARVPQQSPHVAGFTLTAEERQALLAFLHALTDEALLTDPRFANPW